MKSKPSKPLEDRIKQIIVEELGCDELDVTDNANIFDDLHADSLDAVELVMMFEEEFSIQIPDEEAEELRTVKQLVDYVTKKSKKGEIQ